jgi:hypothetical protein
VKLDLPRAVFEERPRVPHERREDARGEPLLEAFFALRDGRERGEGRRGLREEPAERGETGDVRDGALKQREHVGAAQGRKRAVDGGHGEGDEPTARAPG